MVGSSTLAPSRLGVLPATSPRKAGRPHCAPARKLEMLWSRFCMGPGAAIPPVSPSDLIEAFGRLKSVIAMVTRDAPPLWPTRSSGRASCPPAEPPAGSVAAVAAAGCSRPGGAPADASPGAASCLVPPPGVTATSVPVPPGAEFYCALVGGAPASRSCCTTSSAIRPPAASNGAGGAPLGPEATGSVGCPPLAWAAPMSVRAAVRLAPT